MTPLIRKLWRSQPAWLRRQEMRLITRLMARPLDPRRAILAGEVLVGGFFGTASGLGEAARHMLRTFQANGIAAQAVNVSRFAVMEDFEAGPLWPETTTAGGIAVFHVNPDILNLVLGAIGRHRLNKRRIVGCWYWELETIPRKWRHTLRCVDEVWAPSRFIADAIGKALPGKPVYVMSLPVNRDVPTTPRHDPLPQFAGRPLVLFAFDVRSTVARKNPAAVVEAFRRATVNNPDAVLVLKANCEAAWPPAREYLENIVGGAPNIHIMREVLSGDGMRDLVARADVVMSLHRSEGFGLLMAEAMLAAKPVIATGWSSNLDFMTPECSVLVDYKLVPVKDPQNIYNRYGARWAEADVDQAAAALRRLLEDPAERQRMGQAARAHAMQHFSPENWLRSLPQSFWDSLPDGGAEAKRRLGF